MNYKLFISRLRDISGDYNIIPFIINSTGISKKGALLSTIRTQRDLFCPSLIVSNQKMANRLAVDLSSFSRCIFADIEKKIEYVSDDDNVQLGNIYTSIYELSLSKPVVPFKANDLTVEAAFHHLISHYGDIAGLRCGVIGIGNIGSKLAQRLVESGADVALLSRDQSHASNVALYINNCKSSYTLSSARTANRIDQLFFSSDCVVLSGDYELTLSEFSLQCLKQEAVRSKLLLQIGHGTLSSRSLNAVTSIDPFLLRRLDISTCLLRLAASMLYIEPVIPTVLSDLKSRKVYGAYGYMPTSDCDIVNNIDSKDALVFQYPSKRTTDSDVTQYRFHCGLLQGLFSD